MVFSSQRLNYNPCPEKKGKMEVKKPLRSNAYFLDQRVRRLIFDDARLGLQ